MLDLVLLATQVGQAAADACAVLRELPSQQAVLRQQRLRPHTADPIRTGGQQHVTHRPPEDTHQHTHTHTKHITHTHAHTHRFGLRADTSYRNTKATVTLGQQSFLKSMTSVPQLSVSISLTIHHRFYHLILFDPRYPW